MPANRMRLVAWLGAAAAFAVLYADVIRRLVAAWNTDANYSHGFLVVPVAAYIAWRRRAAFTLAAGSTIGLAAMALSFALLVAGELGAELFLTRVSLIAMVGAIALFVAGWPALRALRLPLFLLLLAVPVPAIIFNQVAFPLQLLASRAGEVALNALHIPVLREGNVIVLANTTLEVAEACSGIRSLMSLLSLAVMYGYFTYPGVWPRSILLAASIPIAILANAVRVAATGVASHYYGSAAAEGLLHTFSGWLMFVFAFFLLLGLDALIVRRYAGRAASQPLGVQEVLA